MAHSVQCRVCKQYMDIDSRSDWMMPSTNYYYHIDCYKNWIRKKGDRAVDTDRTEEEWFALLKDYIYRDIKLPNIDWSKVSSQWKNFTHSKTSTYTAKGVYFAIIYFYEIMHGNVENSKGGIGIVPSVYNDSKEYWSNLEMKRKGTLTEIVEQISKRQNRPILTVSNSKNKSSIKKKYSLDDIN